MAGSFVGQPRSGCASKRLRCQAKEESAGSGSETAKTAWKRKSSARVTFQGPPGRVSRGAPWAVRQACASTFGPGYVASHETLSSYTACRPFRDILALQFHCSRVALWDSYPSLVTASPDLHLRRSTVFLLPVPLSLNNSNYGLPPRFSHTQMVCDLAASRVDNTTAERDPDRLP